MLRGGTASSVQPVGLVYRHLPQRREGLRKETRREAGTPPQAGRRAREQHKTSKEKEELVLESQGSSLFLSSPPGSRMLTRMVGLPPSSLGGHSSTVLLGLSCALTHSGRNEVSPCSSGSSPDYQDNELCIEETNWTFLCPCIPSKGLTGMVWSLPQWFGMMYLFLVPRR